MANIKELLASMIGKINGKLNAPEQAAQPHQQLVTDADGVAKWEDKLAYTNTLLSVQSPDGVYAWYKVSDEPLTGIEDVDMGAAIAVWLNGERGESSIVLKQDDFIAVSELLVVAVLRDDCTIELNGVKFGHFPKRGMYFFANVDVAVTAVAIDRNATEPDISWDKNTETIKPIDPKYLGVLITVKFTLDTDSGEITADKPFSEVYAAIKSGATAIAQMCIEIDGMYLAQALYLACASNVSDVDGLSMIAFTTTSGLKDNAEVMTLKFYSDESIVTTTHTLANYVE